METQTHKHLSLKATMVSLACGALLASACSSVSSTPDDRMEPKQKSIVATAQSAGVFGTLVAALSAGELVSVLEGPGPFTVFAPTDDAFAKLPAGTVESLLKPENKAKLQSILKYHVVAGKVLAADVVKLDSAATVEGRSVSIKVSGSTVMINDATVTQADIMASNGVVHVIDSVLLPNQS